MQKHILFIVSLGIAFFVLEWWSRSYYHVSLRDVASQLRQTEISLTKKLIALLATLGAFYIAALLIAAVIRPLPLHYFGEDQLMVFAGFSQPGIAHYYPSPGQDASQDATIAMVNEAYNTSFKGLFLEQKFRGVGVDQHYHGTPAVEYSIYQTLFLFCILCFWLTVLIGSYHILAWSSSILLHTQSELPKAPGQAFDFVMAQSITKGGFAFGLLGAPLLTVVFWALAPKPKSGEPTIDVTRYIQPGQSILGRPVYRMTVERKESEGARIGEPSHYRNRGDRVDTGKRVITLEFPQPFAVPVYVSYTFNAFEQPKVDRFFKRAVKEDELLEFTLSDELELLFELPEDEGGE